MYNLNYFYIMKSILHLITIAFIILVFPHCGKEYLEVKPQGEINSDNYFQKPEHAVWATNAVYERMRKWEFASFPFLALTDIVSDDAVKGSFPADAQRLTTFDDFTYGPTYPEEMSLAWAGHYQAIFRANVAIDNIPKIDMEEALKNRLIGECKFLRAHFYFNLVRWFGAVPLIIRPLTQDEFYNQSRTEVNGVYGQIIQDLQEAIEVLPEKSKYAAADMGRATKGAAKGVLAKVYLTIKDFPNAEKFALEVINSGEYALLPEYNKIFLPEGENSSESLFEIQATALETSWDAATPWNMVQGVRGTPNLGWGFNLPSDDLIRQFEFGDPRREATVLYVGEILPDGTAKVEDNPTVLDEKYSQKAWTGIHPGLQDNGPSNIRILRFSDVVLIAAEALNENGNPTEALRYLNMVRTRARGKLPKAILPEVTLTDKTALRTKIWHERRVEFGMEQQRWFDLVRTGQAEQVMPKISPNFNPAKHLLFPIPQTEIDLSAGLITQNPNY